MLPYKQVACKVPDNLASKLQVFVCYWAHLLLQMVGAASAAVIPARRVHCWMPWALKLNHPEMRPRLRTQTSSQVPEHRRTSGSPSSPRLSLWTYTWGDWPEEDPWKFSFHVLDDVDHFVGRPFHCLHHQQTCCLLFVVLYSMRSYQRKHTTLHNHVQVKAQDTWGVAALTKVRQCDRRDSANDSISHCMRNPPRSLFLFDSNATTSNQKEDTTPINSAINWASPENQVLTTHVTITIQARFHLILTLCLIVSLSFLNIFSASIFVSTTVL